MQSHEEKIDILFKIACKRLKMPHLVWKPMRGRKTPVNVARSYSMGYIDMEKGVITLDIYTPRRREPKSLKSLLRIMAHEIAHLQKPPYRQRYKGRWITRQHYPRFYKQVNKNTDRLLRDKEIIKILNDA